MTKREKDIETVKHFIPQSMNDIPITDKDEQMFFEWSERGLHKDKIGGLPYKMDGFNALVQGKEWRGVHMGMYEDGVLDGSVPYAVLLEGMPRLVVDFLKKEMFKGMDANLIEKCYLKMRYILINYNFTPDWVKEYIEEYLIRIYDRSDSKEWLKDFDQSNIIYTQNVGNADYDKMCWIVDNYDNLPPVFALIKSNLFKYISREEFDKVKDNKAFTPLLTQHHKVYEPTCRYVDGMYEEINNSWYLPQFESRFSSYNEWAQSLGLPTPEYLRFAPGGNYILTPKEIHKYPKEFYVKLRDMLSYTQLPAEAQFLERTYYTLWNTP